MDPQAAAGGHHHHLDQPARTAMEMIYISDRAEPVPASEGRLHQSLGRYLYSLEGTPLRASGNANVDTHVVPATDPDHPAFGSVAANCGPTYTKLPETGEDLTHHLHLEAIHEHNVVAEKRRHEEVREKAQNKHKAEIRQRTFVGSKVYGKTKEEMAARAWQAPKGPRGHVYQQAQAPAIAAGHPQMGPYLVSQPVNTMQPAQPYNLAYPSYNSSAYAAGQLPQPQPAFHHVHPAHQMHVPASGYYDHNSGHHQVAQYYAHDATLESASPQYYGGMQTNPGAANWQSATQQQGPSSNTGGGWANNIQPSPMQQYMQMQPADGTGNMNSSFGSQHAYGRVRGRSGTPNIPAPAMGAGEPVYHRRHQGPKRSNRIRPLPSGPSDPTWSPFVDGRDRSLDMAFFDGGNGGSGDGFGTGAYGFNGGGHAALGGSGGYGGNGGLGGASYQQ